jgi:hypothetical protein
MRSMFVRALLGLVLLSALTAQAVTRQVNGASVAATPPVRPIAINKAILAVANGDTIQIAAGTYAGTIANFSKPLTFIGSGSGTSGTVITKAMTYTGTGPLSLSNLRIQGGGTNFKIGGTGNFSGLTLTNAAFIGNGTVDRAMTRLTRRQPPPPRDGRDRTLSVMARIGACSGLVPMPPD